MPMYPKSSSIKSTEGEAKAWREAADDAGLPLHTWIRCVLDHAAGVGDLFNQLQSAAAAAKGKHAEMMRSRRAEKRAAAAGENAGG